MTRGISQCDIHGEYLECGPHYSCPDCWEEKCKDDPPAVACDPNCPVRFEEAMNSTALLTEISHLRAQLAEAEKQNKTFRTAFAVADDEAEHCKAMLLEVEKERDAAQARAGALESALREARPFVIPTDHEGRSEDELRERYPDSCAAIDRVRTRIDAALAGGAVQ